jgi:hypothetical protein
MDSSAAVNIAWGSELIVVLNANRTGEQAVWVNGIKRWSQSVTNTQNLSSSSKFIMGWLSGNQYFGGKIYEFQFRKAFLSDNEIKEISNLATFWSWNSGGSIVRAGWAQTIAAPGQVSQAINISAAGLHQKSYNKGDDTFVESLDLPAGNYNLILKDGTFDNVSLRSLNPPGRTEIYEVNNNEIEAEIND